MAKRFFDYVDYIVLFISHVYQDKPGFYYNSMQILCLFGLI
jgi:hypothetical protein